VTITTIVKSDQIETIASPTPEKHTPFGGEFSENRDREVGDDLCPSRGISEKEKNLKEWKGL
jgi:hypothetical protein